MSTITIDFLTPELTRRIKRLGSCKEAIAKAIGYKKSLMSLQPLRVLDATAGFGIDAFIMANLGCEVIMLERASAVAALLDAALTRALAMPQYQHLRLKLTHVEACDYLRELPPAAFPDIVYLDPMYQERKKSALNKQPLRVLKSLVGDDKDAYLLLPLALRVARKRVVIKRPLRAENLGGVIPDFVIAGRSCRYDILVQNK